MEPLGGLSDRDLDRIIDGQAPAGDVAPQALAAFVRDVRTTFVRPVPGATRAGHLTAVVAASGRLARNANGSWASPGSVASASAHRRRPLRRAALKVAALAAAAVLVMGGLATAGVLPDPIQKVAAEVLSHVGITVPDGDDADGFSPAPLEEGSTANEHASDTAKAVLGVIDGWLPGAHARGCEFGHAVAQAAGGKAGECTSQAGEATGQERAEEAKAQGQAKAAEGKAQGQAKAAEGKAKGEAASAAGKANAAGGSSGQGGGVSGGDSGGDQ